MREVAHDEHVHAAFRMMGQEREAINHRLSDRAFRWKCRFNGIPPERAPWQFRYGSNATMARYMDSLAARQEPTQ